MKLIVGVGALVAAALVVGCGGQTKTQTVVKTVTTPAKATAAPPASHHVRKHKSARAREATTVAAQPAVVRCDANITVKAATTTCGFAQNAFYEYWHQRTYGDSGSLRAYSEAAGQWLALDCNTGATVTCNTADGGLVRFPLSAIGRYDESQAAAYVARGHRVSAAADAAIASQNPSGVDSSSSDSAGSSAVNQDDYSNHDGTYNGDPTTEDFGSGSGSVGKCADGTYSDSIGRPGACSHHGGVG